MRSSILKMTPADVPEVLAFWKSVGFHRIPSGRALSRFLEKGFGMVVRADGNIAAAAVCGICGPGAGYFEYFAVETGRRRTGIGRRLYKACAADLFESGVRRVLFLVDGGNDEAEAFWIAMGKSPIKSARPFFGKLTRADLT